MTETRKTLRSVTLTIFDEVPDWETLKSRVKYFAYGNEICPSTGTAHKQGFAYAWKPMRFATWKSLFPGVHIEEMRGDFRENTAYCSKESELVEFGEKPNRHGVKSTVLNYKRKLDEGKTVMEVAEEEEFFPTMLQYRNGLEAYKRHVRAKSINEFYKPEVYVRIGPPRTGKTRWVFDKYGFGNVTTMYPYQGGRLFVPPNVGDVVLFDDVEAGSVVPVSIFKQLTDGNPRLYECKGGDVMWRPKVIVFTSNSHPFSWWPDLSEFDKKAIEERITEIVVVE